MRLLHVAYINSFGGSNPESLVRCSTKPDLHRILPVCWQTRPEGALGLVQLADEGISWLQVTVCGQPNPPQRSVAIPWAGTYPSRSGMAHCHQLQRMGEEEITHQLIH